MIKNWSFSRLTEFESCAWRSKLKIIDRIPEPERELKPGQTEHANDRGSRIHDALEQYVRGKGQLPVEAKHFVEDLESLKTHFKAKRVQLEEEWGFDEDWKPCDYKTAWLKVKCDAVVKIDDHLIVIDYKTGRKQGNEIKHGEQCSLYAIAGSIMHPEVNDVTIELWYIDKDDLTREKKPVTKWLSHLKLFNNRGHKMTNASVFKPNPNVWSCQYCPYKDGICEYAVDTEKENMKKARGAIHARRNVKPKTV